MLIYILRRVLMSVPVLLGMTVLLFFLADRMPGDAVLAMISSEVPVSAELIAIRQGQLGLDDPLPVQYVKWLAQVVRGNLGYSYISGAPVAGLIAGRIPATLQLMGAALLFALVVGVVLGLVSAVWQRSAVDYILTVLGFMGLATPVFFLGMVFVYVFSLQLKLLPTSGMATLGDAYSFTDNLRHLLLPALALGMVRTAEFTRYTRASMLEVIRNDYIRTARAKGVGEHLVILKHAFRNALIPVITVLGVTLPVLFSGAVIIETVFQWPGIGLMYIAAVTQRDAPIIMGLALVTGLIVLVSNLLADILYSVVDPRIQYT